MKSRESFKAAIRRVFRDYILGLRKTGALGKVLERAAADAEFKARLIESPRSVLEQSGVVLPDGINVEVLVNTEKLIHIVLPPYIGNTAEGGRSCKPTD